MTHAISRVELKITQLQQEIQQSGIATDELKNRLLRPLQLVKADLKTEVSIPQIFMLQKEVADERLDDALEQLNKAIDAEEAKRKAAAKKPQPVSHEVNENAGAAYLPTPVKQAVKPAPALVKAKPVVDVLVNTVLSQVSKGLYIENANDVKAFIDALEKELTAAITIDKRVRIR